MKGKNSVKFRGVKIAFLCCLILYLSIWGSFEICYVTGGVRSQWSVFGIPVRTRYSPGYQEWLENEVGVQVRNYFCFKHRFLLGFQPRIGGLPGNWMKLRSAKTFCDENSSKQDEMFEIIRRIESRDRQVLTFEEGLEIHMLKYPDQEEGIRRFMEQSKQ